MPQIIFAKTKSRKLLTATAYIAAAAVIVAAVGGYFVWRLVPSASKTAAMVDADNLKGVSYGQNYALIKSAYDRAIFKSDKALLLSRLAAASEDNNNQAQALAYFQDLDKLQPNQLTTLLPLGDLAQQMGRGAIELSADKQAIVLLKAGPQQATTQADVDSLASRDAELSK